jgi:thioredoxin-related protein
MARPIVDGLEEEWNGDVEVLRLNVQGDGIRPLLQDLNFRYTPTFILFDGSGSEIWRTNGALDPEVVNAQLADLKQ